MKRFALFFLSLTISLGWAVAQNRTITGTVTSSEDGEPVIAANVVVEGKTSVGTVTDVDGKFSLSVPAGAKRLVFSYVGMKSQTLDIQNVMNVVLDPDDGMLETVVVMGYGSGQKLSTVSGSVAHVSTEKIAERPVANVMDGLQGQVAGMQVQTFSGDPNAVADIKIHGQGSLGASGTPLYIVDGMQTDASVISSMNPNDFESVTVLKDAASTSIYGARAANGVILITTKRGKMSDEADGKIVFNAQYGVSQITTRKPMNQVMTGRELIEYQARHRFEGNRNAQDLMKALLKPDDEDKSKLKYPIYDPNFQQDFDWLKYYLGNVAPTYQADLSMQGGTSRTTYYLSLGHYSQDAISVQPSLYKKYSGRINLDSRVKEWLKVGVNLAGSVGQRRYSTFSGSNFYNAGSLGALLGPPYYTPLEADGSYRRGYYYWMGMGRQTSQGYNSEFFKSADKEYLASVGGYLQLNPIEGLTLKTQVGTDVAHTRNTARLLPGAPELDTESLGFRRETFDASYQTTFTNTAEYKFNIKDDHGFTVLFGQEWVGFYRNAFSAAASGLEHPDFSLLGNGRRENYLSLPSQVENHFAYLSFFGRVNYNWKDLLYLDASLRNDQSSRFGTGKRSAMFYSLGAMFDLRRALFDDVEWLDALRLRASWGTTGNSAIPLNAYQAWVGSTRYTNSLSWGVASFGNDNLSWESQGNFNFGVSADMFDSRLRASLDYYLRTTSNMLVEVPLGYSTGFAYRYENVGSMYNTGIDLMLEYDILRTKDWNVYASTIFNFNAEKVTKLFHGLDSYSPPMSPQIWEVGKARRFFVADYVGVSDTGKQLWRTPDGGTTDVWEPLLLERAIPYNVNPPINGGFSMGASWKGLALDMDWAYVLGKYTLNNDRFFLENNVEGFLALNRSKKLLDEWQKPGDEANTMIPAYGQDAQFDSRFIENASFLRLKNLRLSYTMPGKWFANTGVISGVKVYVMARNVLTVTPFTGFDPEAVGIVARNQFPNTMQFAGGLQLLF